MYLNICTIGFQSVRYTIRTHGCSLVAVVTTHDHIDTLHVSLFLHELLMT